MNKIIFSNIWIEFTRLYKRRAVQNSVFKNLYVYYLKDDVKNFISEIKINLPTIIKQLDYDNDYKEAVLNLGKTDYNTFLRHISKLIKEQKKFA